MIEIKPTIQHQSTCPHTGNALKPKNILWHGMHVCAVSDSPGCESEIIDDLKISHAIVKPCQVDLKQGLLFGTESAKKDYGKNFLESLQNPTYEEIEISKEVFKSCKRVIVLNCIDFLYGHCLLKLLNAQRHLEEHPDFGLIVIVQKFLRWMVPEGVAEIWTVNISLKNGQKYYPSFDKFVQAETERFDEIYVSEAHSHPSKFDLSKFTRVVKHDFEKEEFKITFVWREDRLWCSTLLFRALRKLKMLDIGLFIQNWKVRRLLGQIRSKIPSAKFAVTGLGQKTRFPEWIEDFRVQRYNEETEKQACQVYSESRLVIGIHGSNMLLPSGQAGMTIDLMPEKRWGNFAQDILYHETDPRLASFRYRYLPHQTSIAEITYIAAAMMRNYRVYYLRMTADK